jgi:hypothetical protein
MECEICGASFPPPPVVITPEDDRAYEEWLEMPCLRCKAPSRRASAEIARRTAELLSA